MTTRSLSRVIRSIPTTEGGGVKLRRSLGQVRGLHHDPFLMLDEFATEKAEDYIAGFPNHPHRGFQTVTYMLAGHMLHEDHLGNRGDLRSGGAQWMKAGRGIIHSEMPQQESGLMHGFQLWVNLPASEKMQPAAYRDIQPEEIPVATLPGGGQVKVVAGTAEVDGGSVSGPIQGLSTEPLFLDVRLPAGGRFVQPIAPEHNAFVYPYEGQVEIGAGSGERRPLATQSVGLLSEGERIEISADGEPAAFLVLAGRPLHEPVAQYGPFVMNTREEIDQAIQDYQSGHLV
jgi:quercetin 2,3-dioxygenase